MYQNVHSENIKTCKHAHGTPISLTPAGPITLDENSVLSLDALANPASGIVLGDINEHILVTFELQFTGTMAEEPTCYATTQVSDVVPTGATNETNAVMLDYLQVGNSYILKGKVLVPPLEISAIDEELQYFFVGFGGTGVTAGTFTATMRAHKLQTRFLQPTK